MNNNKTRSNNAQAGNNKDSQDTQTGSTSTDR